MAVKNQNPTSRKTKPTSVSVANDEPVVFENKSKANLVMAVILVLVVVLVFVWKFSQMANHDIPKLKTDLILKFDSNIKGAGTFIPWGAVAIGTDKIIVADNQGNRLIFFNRKGDFVKSIGTFGKSAGQFHEPSGMTTDDQGNAYVVDAWNSAIKGFNEKGKEIANLDFTNQGFFGPRGIGFDGHNFVVADTGSHRVVLIGPQGNILGSHGSIGVDESHFKGPLAVTSDEKGRYYVADTDNDRVQILDSNFKKIRFIEDFKAKVNSVAVDKEGRIYVGTEANDGEVEVFNSDGKPLGTLVDHSGSGEPFRGAKYMSITFDDLLLLTNGDAVYLYQLPSFNQK